MLCCATTAASARPNPSGAAGAITPAPASLSPRRATAPLLVGSVAAMSACAAHGATKGIAVGAAMRQRRLLPPVYGTSFSSCFLGPSCLAPFRCSMECQDKKKSYLCSRSPPLTIQTTCFLLWYNGSHVDELLNQEHNRPRGEDVNIHWPQKTRR